MNFSEIHPAGHTLDIFLDNEKPSPVLAKMGDPNIALRVMRSGLWFSKLFNRYTVPTYAAHVFKTVSTFETVDDELGTLLAGVMGTIKGELFNNNIYGKPRECHSHYEDMLTAYVAAGGSRDDHDAGKRPAYRIALDLVLSSPLATFIFIAANEKWTPGFFEVVSKNLCREPRFDMYRQFVDRHIELDRGEHSSVAMDWLAYVVKKGASTEPMELAIKDVIALISLGR